MSRVKGAEAKDQSWSDAATKKEGAKFEAMFSRSKTRFFIYFNRLAQKAHLNTTGTDLRVDVAGSMREYQLLRDQINQIYEQYQERFTNVADFGFKGVEYQMKRRNLETRDLDGIAADVVDSVNRYVSQVSEQLDTSEKSWKKSRSYLSLLGRLVELGSRLKQIEARMEAEMYLFSKGADDLAVEGKVGAEK